ncbi:hypothetical protein NDU88_008196 [Pleurodeles waltl]|uniref:Uncharacterized protein n=1 Tax=Pleurodeles waltl TaxID=8319 RepID=A0AAV7P2Y1_PLEWA|nr:hypothetical protein NDU88_008196 [Pleurodeles waltl]
MHAGVSNTFRSMSFDELVQEVVQLLRQAGSMDVLGEVTLAEAYPARRVASGMVAAVWACSPPCQSRSLGIEEEKGVTQWDLGEPSAAP